MPLTLTRSLLAILIPGTVAATPWLLWLALEFPDIRALYRGYLVLGNAVLFAVVAVTGNVIEGLGTYFEVRWDTEREAKFSVRENWYAYLAQEAVPGLVGHGYISRMATSLYFELGMMLSTPLFLLGIAVVAYVSHVAFNSVGLIVFAILAVGSAMYFHKLARDSHEVLCEAREELVKRRPTSATLKPATGDPV